ncbi:LutC/YkgG family protein [Prosthecomicrobium sp. N25]|uniref:LutC/YkgG family protein n=1 Tax=Prosthecomicrobium sp. N25 TaxID=3129254 RepID=UPI003078A18E
MSRDVILSKIRRSLGAGPADVERRAAVSDRLTRSPRGIIPKRGQLPPAEQVRLFAAMAEKVSTTVAHVASPDEIPAAVADYLRSRNLPAAIRRGDDPRLAGLPWESQPQLAVATGPSDGRDLAGLSHAFAAVAETGTLVLTSGPENPTTLNFLPEYHLVVLRAEDVEGDVETVWERIRARYGKGALPRTVNMITGPSRSGDIEQTILLGAHGPRSLHVIVVGAAH